MDILAISSLFFKRALKPLKTGFIYFFAAFSLLNPLLSVMPAQAEALPFPARYLEQDLSWGALALNMDKPFYYPGERANIAMAVLDEKGMMACDADLRLTVQHQESGESAVLSTSNKTITVNPDCQVKNYTEHPDFSSALSLNKPGLYALTLTATTKNGTRSITDYVTVVSQMQPFVITRTAPTRTYPNAVYEMNIRVTANQGFSGMAIEGVPNDFKLAGQLKVSVDHADVHQITSTILDPQNYVSSEGSHYNISFPLTLKTGESATLSYSFQPPPTSPEFYQFEPLKFLALKNLLQGTYQEIFKEPRQWLIANDAAAAIRIILTSGTSWVAPADWNTASNTIEVIGAGGKGGGLASAQAAGAGAGAYSKLVNATITPGSTVTIQVGTGGGASGAADTYVCNANSGCTAISAAAAVVGAKGGTSASGATAGVGGGQTGNTGNKGTVSYNGGSGSTSGGGGGAGGPSGAGTTASTSGGGAADNGTVAGGSGGNSCTVGNNGAEWGTGKGSGSGGGGFTKSTGGAGCAGGTYGGAGGGSRSNTTTSAGQNGLIVITYTPTIALSGTAYASEGGAALASKTIKLLINGSATTSTTTAADGTFIIRSGTTVNSGDVLTVYIAGDATYKGMIVDSSNAASSTGLSLYGSVLNIISDDGSAITNAADLATADNNIPASDLVYSISGSDITFNAGVKILITTGDTYAPGGNVTADAMEIKGTYTGASETLTLKGVGTNTFCTAAAGAMMPLCISGGTFTPTTNTIVFSGASAAVTIASTTYNSLTLAPSAAGSPIYTLLGGGTTTVNSVLTVGNGTNPVTVTLSTSTNPNLSVTGATTITANATVTTGAGNAVFGGGITLNGTFNGSGSGGAFVTGSLTGSGTVNLTGGTLEMRGTGNLGGSTAWAFNNLNIGNGATASTTLAGSGSITITGNMSIGSTSQLGGAKDLTVGGNWTNSGTFYPGSNTITFNGSSGSATITGGTGGFNNLVFNNASGQWTVQDSSLAVSGNITMTAGTLLGSGSLTVNGGSVTGNGTIIFTASSSPTNLLNVKQITAGYYHTCALTNSGNAYCWGYNGSGLIGDNTSGTNSLTPVRVLKGAAATSDTDGTNLTNVSQIAAGVSLTCALTNSGNAYCWGDNTYGQLGDNTSGTNRLTPVRVLKGAAATSDTDGTNLINVKQIAAGNSHTCATTNAGNAYCWGDDTYGQLGDNYSGATLRLTPVQVLKGAAAASDTDGTNLTNVSQITVGYYHTCALTNSGNAYCWGSNGSGQIGDSTSGTNRLTPVRVLKGAAATSDTDGTNLTNVKQIAVGTYHTCATTNAGNAYCWGYDGSGQLGDNTSGAYRLTPVQVLKGAAAASDTDGTNLTNVSQITVGYYHTCALTNSGNAYCWGSNGSGQIGDSTSGTNRLTPVRVLKGAAATSDTDGTNLINVKQLATGSSHTCALTNAGNAYCWGDDTYGQLGDNTSGASRLTPVITLNGQASGETTIDTNSAGTNLFNVKQIAAGGYHTCALTNSGNAYCWGDDTYGQIGDNYSGVTLRLTPVRVLKGAAAASDNDGTNLTNVSQITAGDSHTCALTNAGNAYCWGYDGSGQVGDNSSGTNRLTPVRVLKGAAAASDNDGTNLTNVKKIAAGYYHTCATTNYGNAYCWGYDGSGQIGDNSSGSTLRLTPVRVLKGAAAASDNDGTNLTNVSQLVVGYYHTCALTNAGNAYCWGNDGYGQLGDNTSGTNRLTPVQTLKGQAYSGLGFFTVSGTGNFGGNTPWTFYNLNFGSGASGVTSIQGSGNITVNGVLTVAGSQTLNASAKTYNLNGSGNPFVAYGTFTAQTSTISYNGTTSAISITPTTYNNLSIGTNATTTLSNSATTTLTGNLAINGTLDGTGSVLAFAPTATSTITSAATTTFGSIYIASPGKALAFQKYNNNNLFNIAGTLTVAGTTGNLVSIVSDTPNQPWRVKFLNPQSNIHYAYIKDGGCDAASASANLSDGTSVDGGNNGACWNFVMSVTVSGIVYDTDETTAILSALPVKLAVGDTISYSATTSASNGSYTISLDSRPATGTVMTLWLDTNGGTQASAVFKYGSGCNGNGNNDCTGINLIKNSVIIDNKDTGSITNNDLAACDNDSGTACSDADIGFTSNSGSLNLTWGSNQLRIKDATSNFVPGGNITASGFSQSAGKFDGGSFSDTINGNFILAGGMTTSTSGTLAVSGNWTSNSGSPVFNNNGGTVSFTADNSTITPGSLIFNNFIIEGSYGNTKIVSGTLTVQGDFTGKNTSYLNVGTVQFTGAANQTFNFCFYGSSNCLNVQNAVINKSSGSITFATNSYFDNVTITALGGGLDLAGYELALKTSFVNNASTAFSSTGLVYFGNGSDSFSFTPGTTVYPNVRFGSMYGHSATLTGTLFIQGDLTDDNIGSVSGGEIDLVGTANQTVNTSLFGGAYVLTINSPLVINKPSGTVTLAFDLTLGGALTITSGTLDQGASYNITTGGLLTVGASGRLTNSGTGDLALGGNVVNNGTIILDGSGAGCGGTDAIAITSTGGARTWSGSGTFNLTDVALSNQTASVAITIYSGTDVTGNTGSWTWSGCANNVTFSGVVYDINGSSALLAADTIKLAVASSTLYSTTTLASDGIFSFAVSKPATSTVITIWLSGSTDKASLVFKYGNDCIGVPNCTNLNLIKNQVIIDNKDSAGGSMTNALLAACDNDSGASCSDTDIGFTSNAGVLTTTWATNKLKINSGVTFAPGGNVSLQALDISGTYTGGSETLTLSGTGTPLTINGVLNPGTSTFSYRATTGTSTIAEATYYNMDVSPASGNPTYLISNQNAVINQVENLKTAGCPGSVCTITFSTPTTAGELVVVNVSTGYYGNGITGITDNQGNTYTPIWSDVGEYHRRSSLYYLANAPSGIDRITVTIAAGNSGGVVAAHYTGIAAVNPLDVYSSPTSASSSPTWSSGAVTTTQAAELLIGTDIFVLGSGSPVEISPSGNWIQDQTDGSGSWDGGNGNVFSFAHQSVSSIKTGVQNTGTNPVTVIGNNYAGIATFKAATATLVISNNFTLGGAGNATVDASSSALSVLGNFTIGSGDIFLAPKATTTISGNFTNNGTFTHNNGTVTFSSSSVTSLVSGAMAFNNFTSTAAGKTIKFASSTIFTFAGTMTLTGDSFNRITLQSDSSGAQWLAHFNNPQNAITFAAIKDSGCHADSSDANLDDSNFNNGNNGSCWKFPPVKHHGGGYGGGSLWIEQGPGAGTQQGSGNEGSGNTIPSGSSPAVIADSYGEGNANSYIQMPSSGLAVAQSFTAIGGILDYARFYLEEVGNPTGVAVAKLYAITGTFGTNSRPTGVALATSDNFNASILTASPQLITFNFSGANRIALVNGTNYVISVEYSGDNFINVKIDTSSLTHTGNTSYYNGSWISNQSWETIFYLHEVPPADGGSGGGIQQGSGDGGGGGGDAAP